MRPQLVIQDVMGKQNNNLSESTSRIIRGGSWKKQRVIIIIPAADLIPAKIYLNHCSIIFPPNQGAHRMLALGQEVGEAYSNTIESILAQPDLKNFEYICTLEHDNLVPNDGLIKLIARMEERPEFAAISGLYWTKGEGGVPQCWGDPTDSVLNYRPQPPPPLGECREYCGIGMGFALWRLSMFKDTRLRRPWFKTLADKNGVATQDLQFTTDARQYGYRFAVDSNVLCGHYDFNTDMVW